MLAIITSGAVLSSCVNDTRALRLVAPCIHAERVAREGGSTRSVQLNTCILVYEEPSAGRHLDPNPQSRRGRHRCRIFAVSLRTSSQGTQRRRCLQVSALKTTSCEVDICFWSQHILAATSVRSFGKLLRANKLPLRNVVREDTSDGQGQQTDNWKPDLPSAGV